jgi:hypothetical protein
MSIDTEKIAQVSTAMIIVEQANKIKTLEAKNGELEKHNEMLAHQLKYAENILTYVQAHKFKLREKLKIAMEALEYVDGWWYNPHLYDETIAEEKMNETLAAIKDS